MTRKPRRVNREDHRTPTSSAATPPTSNFSGSDSRTTPPTPHSGTRRNGGAKLLVESGRKEGSSSLGKLSDDQSRLPAVNCNWMQLQATLSKGHGSRRASKKKVKPNPQASIHANPSTGNSAAAGTVTGASAFVPSSDDCSVTKVLALDCEMVGVGHEGKRSALARASLVNRWGNVVYDKHVRPLEFVTDFRTPVSGVRSRDLRKAEDLWTVQKEVAELLKGRILVGHALHNDLKVLMLSHPRKHMRDTHTYRPFRSKTGRPRALRHLAALYLGQIIQDGEHNSVEDARAAMFLYQQSKEEWEQSLRHRSTSAGFVSGSKKVQASR